MGRLLLLALIPIGALILGYALGTMQPRTPQPAKLTRPERRELDELRKLKNSTRSIASNHLVLDSALATILIDEVNTTEAKINGTS